MNRSWITASRISDEYENGIEEFLQFAKRNEIGVNNKYYCPCVNCVNVIRQNIELIREHVLCDGFLNVNGLIVTQECMLMTWVLH